MDQIWTTRELRERGFSKAELARQLRSGELARLRRGAYELPIIDDGPEGAVRRHRRLVHVTASHLGPGAVVSHASAAVLHRLPVWPKAIERVHVTRNRSNGARCRSVVSVHGAALPATDMSVVDGVVVTSLARTVLDLARTLPWEEAVAAGDRALALGLDPAALDEVLARMAHWRGARQARRVLGVLDPASESPGESVSRVRFVEQGIPAPRLQYVVVD
jgi:predicted transcriptional regulator of viral defense system